MRSGTLRHRLTLQEPTTYDDVAGEEGTGYTDLVTVWGRVKAAGGGEQVVASQVQAVQRYEIEIRWMALPTTTDGVAWNHLRVYWQDQDRTFKVNAANDPYGRRINLLLDCQEET